MAKTLYQQLLKSAFKGDTTAKSAGDLLIIEIARRRQEFIDQLARLIGNGISGEPLGERVYTVSSKVTMTARSRLLALFMEIRTMFLSTKNLEKKYGVRRKEVEDWYERILNAPFSEVLRIWNIIDQFLYDKEIIKVDKYEKIDYTILEADNLL